MITVNEYFEGNVKSLVANNDKGNATLGVIAPGIYEFGTSTIEIMTVVWGEMEVELPGESAKLFTQGSSFQVNKGESFKVNVKAPVGYVCEYR